MCPNRERLVKAKDMEQEFSTQATPPPGAFIFCALDPVVAQRKLVAILSRLSSPFDGERAAAGKLATELLNRLDLQWADIVRIGGVIESRPSPAPPDWHEMLRVCAQHFQDLSKTEQVFVANLATYTHRPTARQLTWLNAIYERVHGGEQ